MKEPKETCLVISVKIPVIRDASESADESRKLLT